MDERVVEIVNKENKELKNRNEKMLEIKKISGFLGIISLLFGLVYTICLYQNPSGITYPIFVAASYGICMTVLRKLGIPMKKKSWFLVAVSFLLAISTCRTLDAFIIDTNRVVIFLLTCIFIIHQFYDDEFWNLGKYIESIIFFLITAVTLIAYPFRHAAVKLKAKNGKFRNLAFVGIGLGCSVPVIIMLVFLLSTADKIFNDMMAKVWDLFFDPWTVIAVIAKMVLGTLALYCLISAAYLKNLEEKVVDRRKQEPLIAISGLTVIALIYLVFCFIQIVYLFMGVGIPAGFSYSSYARQGFFQLVFVVCVNLFMVLLCLKYFKKNKCLNIILTVINACTFVMIASAAYRMLLYVGEYHLTYLRVLVLWFLAMVTVLMVGVVAITIKNSFPLFKFSLVTASLFYLAFAWVRPEALIAEYNIAQYASMNESGSALSTNHEGLKYLKDRLSIDALPAIMNAGDTISEEYKKIYYQDKVFSYEDSMGIRKYNFAAAKACRLMKSEP